MNCDLKPPICNDHYTYRAAPINIVSIAQIWPPTPSLAAIHAPDRSGMHFLLPFRAPAGSKACSSNSRSNCESEKSITDRLTIRRNFSLNPRPNIICMLVLTTNCHLAKDSVSGFRMRFVWFVRLFSVFIAGYAYKWVA